MADGTGARARPPQGWAFYGITTENRPERAAHLEAECRRAGIDLRLHVARRPSDPGGFASVGIRGCFESHLHCLRAAHADGVEAAVIVEDDVVLVRRLGERIAALARELSDAEWTIAYLGHLGSQSPVGRQDLQLQSAHVAASAGWEVTGSHFLVVRGDALHAVIDNFTARLVPGGHQIPVDGAYNEFRRDSGSSTLLSVPSLARQAPSRSGITDVAGRRQAVLDVVWARSVLLAIRRFALNASAVVPPWLWVRGWNVRAAAGRARRRQPEMSSAASPESSDRT